MPASDAPSHAQLRYAMYEYLHAVIKAGKMTEEQTESLEVAAQCMFEAFGFSSEVPEGGQHELSLKPLTLPVIFNTGVQVLSGPIASGASSPAKTAGGAAAAGAAGAGAGVVATGAANPDSGDGSDDSALFKKFVSTLKDRGFFAGLSEGTPEWEERESKARAKFNQRYNNPAAVQPANPGAQDQQRSAQEELRQRLALETKRMEDAEVGCQPRSCCRGCQRGVLV